MGVSKSVGVVLLAGIVAMLSVGKTHAQNPAAAQTQREAPLPKDIYPDSRNRLPLPKPETPQPKARLPVGIEQPGVRSWDPELTKLMGEASRKYEVGLNDQLLEIAVLVAAREMDCQYEWTQWETHGRDPKDPRLIEPAIIDIIKYEKPVVGLGEKEAAIIKFGRETFGQRKVSSETFAEVLRLFGRKGTVDLFWLMAGYSSSAAELAAFDNHLTGRPKTVASSPAAPVRCRRAKQTSPRRSPQPRARSPRTFIPIPGTASPCQNAKTWTMPARRFSTR